VTEPRWKIQTLGLTVDFGKTRALSEVSLGVAPQRITALIGPSGSGKSVFLRSLNRMNDLVPGVRVSGQVLLDTDNVYDPGFDVSGLRRRVGMIFRRSNPFPMTIFENIAYGLRVQRVRDRHAIERVVRRSLEAVSLWEEVGEDLHRSALGLSDGQRQRLCIARALAIEPEVLLMDEPAGELDPAATAGIEELIRELGGRYTVVIATHNLQQAARLSEVTAFFYAGRLVEVDETPLIFTNPSRRETEDYVTGRLG
jgi:phosphate transport system ATP-binding protein